MKNRTYSKSRSPKLSLIIDGIKRNIEVLSKSAPKGYMRIVSRNVEHLIPSRLFATVGYIVSVKTHHHSDERIGG